jgi:lipopolysaccharide export system protein LptA
MRRILIAGLLAATAATSLPDSGQQQQDCDLEVVRTPGSEGRMVTLEDGEVRIDQWNGVEAVCGDRRLIADSASYYQNAEVLYLHGNMVYTDSERRLESERGTYYEQQAMFRAEGNVRLTNNDGRSTLTGPVLDYFPTTALRPVERMFASGRPHLKFYPEEPGPGSFPFDVDADRLHIYGESVLAGAGDVVVERTDLTATGDSLDLDLTAGYLWMFGEPVVTAGQMVLEGDTVLALMEERQISEIQAWPNATATGSELMLEAPSLRLFVGDEDIERVVASAGDPERTGVVDTLPRDPWARGESQDYSLVADSMDILRPGGVLDRVIAVQRARAVSLKEHVPGGGLLYSDWLEGDTITAFFTMPTASPDSIPLPSQDPQLTRLEAAGGEGDARTLYYLAGLESNGESGQPSPNYIIGKQVILLLEAGEVKEAQVIGPALGLYLEPIPVSPDDTLQADTTGLDTIPRAVIEAMEDSARAPRDTTDTTGVGGANR